MDLLLGLWLDSPFFAFFLTKIAHPKPSTDLPVVIFSCESWTTQSLCFSLINAIYVYPKLLSVSLFYLGWERIYKVIKFKIFKLTNCSSITNCFYNKRIYLWTYKSIIWIIFDIGNNLNLISWERMNHVFLLWQSHYPYKAHPYNCQTKAK